MNSTTGQKDRLVAFDADLAVLLKEYKSVDLFKRPPLCTPVEDVQTRLSSGRYLLRPGGVEFHREHCNRLASDLFKLLIEHLPEDAEAFTAIKDKCASGEIDLLDILDLTFRNQATDLMRIFREHGIRHDLMSFFAVYYARPYRAAAARILLEGIDLAKWQTGYCPVCGHWPSLSHIKQKEGQRSLWCLHCGTHWPFKRITCAFCLNEDYQSLEIITPVGNETYRAQVCNKCRRYIKELRTDLPIEDIPLDAAFLATMTLDTAVLKEGYIRESPLIVRFEDPDGSEILMYSHQGENNQEF